MKRVKWLVWKVTFPNSFVPVTTFWQVAKSWPRSVTVSVGSTAAKVASYLTGSPVQESDEVARETVCELANMVIGSAVTALNDQGFKFKIYPPVVHVDELGEKSSEDQESLVMCFDTDSGNIFMNIAMRYNRKRRTDN